MAIELSQLDGTNGFGLANQDGKQQHADLGVAGSAFRGEYFFARKQYAYQAKRIDKPFEGAGRRAKQRI